MPRFSKTNINGIAIVRSIGLKILKEGHSDQGSNLMPCLQASEHHMCTNASSHYFISKKSFRHWNIIKEKHEGDK